MDKLEKEGANLHQSPRFFRRKNNVLTNSESTNTAQGKVVLGEVEEKLKFMRQKRLDRLSAFVAEQSKLSEERGNPASETNEIENAIVTIKQAKEEKKVNIETIKEEGITVKEKVKPSQTPTLSRKSSNESKDKSFSSTKKFINKFNCASQSTYSSMEDLADDTAYKKTQDDLSKIDKTEDIHSSEERTKIMTQEKHDETYHPLLSPVGKQRKGIYMYDTECKFLEDEKNTCTKYEDKTQYKDEVVSQTVEDNINLRTSIEIKSNEKLIFKEGKDVIIHLKTRHSYENRDGGEKLSMKTFKRSSVGDILDYKDIKSINFDDESPSDKELNQHLSKNNNSSNINAIIPGQIKNFERVDIQLNKNINVGSLNRNHVIQNVQTKPFENDIPKSLAKPQKIAIKNYQKENVPKPTAPKSPMPLPRRLNDQEKILKKFQRNWDALDEILENDSDVDLEEVDDLRRTLKEASRLLGEYKEKLGKLEEKITDSNHFDDKLNVISDKLKDIEVDTSKFKGLRRDVSYEVLKNKVQECLLELTKIENSNVEIVTKKTSLRKKVEKILEKLERRVDMNEIILIQVLEAQVDSISTNIFNITKV